MGLPKITFNVLKNGLELATGAVQKIPGMILTGVTIAGDDMVTVGLTYQIFSLEEAVAMGVTAEDNAYAYGQIQAFYSIAGTGAELWFMLVTSVTDMTAVVDIENAYAKKLIEDSKGKIRVFGVGKASGATETITNGIDADAHTAVVKAQALCADFADKYYPVRCIIGGNKYSGTVADLINYKTSAFNRVSLLIAGNDTSKNASIGLLMGRMASISTQRKISRVKDGPVENTAAYFTGGQTIESLMPSWDAIHDKGYIFLRNFANRSGYYFTSDVTLTQDSDDFNSLARGLVMDEAVILSYDTLIENLSDEVPMTSAGNIHPGIIKSWQNAITNALTLNMVNQVKLSAVKVTIDPNQNVLQTNNVTVNLQLLPVGYADFITVNIGFTTNIE